MSIPVFGVPYVNRPDIFTQMIQTIDYPIDRFIVIDNSPDGSCPVPPGAIHIAPHHNLGVAASWNLIIKASPLADWWALMNSDLIFAPGDLERLDKAMAEHEQVFLEGMAAFGLKASVIEKVGWFDESYHPAYVEDDDWRWRCKLAEVDMFWMSPGVGGHVGSSVIHSDAFLRGQNYKTYDANVSFHIRKWGGMMHEEVFTTPFNRGGSIKETNLSIERLRDQTWKFL